MTPDLLDLLLLAVSATIFFLAILADESWTPFISIVILIIVAILYNGPYFNLN